MRYENQLRILANQYDDLRHLEYSQEIEDKRKEILERVLEITLLEQHESNRKKD